MENLQSIYERRISIKQNQTINHWNKEVMQPRIFGLYEESIEMILHLFFTYELLYEFI